MLAFLEGGSSDLVEPDLLSHPAIVISRFNFMHPSKPFVQVLLHLDFDNHCVRVPPRLRFAKNIHIEKRSQLLGGGDIHKSSILPGLSYITVHHGQRLYV